MKISIVIPCYNSEKYIDECITSCVNQSYNNTEIIVFDNESSDKSAEKIKNLQNKLSSHFGTRISLKADEKNKGEIRIPFVSTEDLNRILEILNI